LLLPASPGAPGRCAAGRSGSGSPLPRHRLLGMIPDYESVMRPMLAFLSDGEQRDTVWLREELAKHFDVSSEERARLLPSGTGRLFDNKLGWAYTNLKHALAIERVVRATYRITPRGLKLL